MAIRHSITLSTTEPNNEIGVIKIRQADEQTQTLEVQITENGVPKSYQGLAVYFCAKLGQTAGLGIIEQKLNPEEMTNPENGKLEYTMRAEDWQILGRQKGYFSFRKMKDEHEFVEQFTTRDFTFDVIKSVYSDGIKEVKKDGSTYVWTIEELIRLFKEYVESGKTDWEEFVEQNREIIESVDPSGTVLTELIDARKPFGEEAYPNLGKRLDNADDKLKRKVYYFNSIAELKEANNLSVGDFAVTLGYYESRDGGGAKYQISNSGVDDGGSVHNLSNSLKAMLICGNGVDCAVFGATRSHLLPKEDVIEIFENWTNYVNNTKDKFFKPTKQQQSYFLYAPLYIRKSFIGVNNPQFMYVSSEVGKVVSSTAKTDDGRFDFNVSAVMGVHPLTYSDSQDRLEFKNFGLMCTSGDDDITPAQDYGFYYPQGTSSSIDNVIVYRPQKAGFKSHELWMARLQGLNTWKSRGDGFSMIGTFTSLDVSHCYAHGFKRRAFDIAGAMYSNFRSLGADSGQGRCCYAFNSCFGTTISDLGTEECDVEDVLYVGDFFGTVDGLFILSAKVSASIVTSHTGSGFKLSGLYVKDCTIKSGTTPNSFRFLSAGSAGDSYNVSITNNSDTISLGSYTARPLFSDFKGRVAFDIIDNPYSVQKNKKIYKMELTENESNYEKMSTGQQRCYQSITLDNLVVKDSSNEFVSAVQRWTFPETFASVNNVNLEIVSADRNLWIAIKSIATTHVDYVVCGYKATTYTVLLKAFAEGFYK